MSKVLLGLSIITLLIATSAFGWQYYEYWQSINTLPSSDTSSGFVINPNNKTLSSINFYSLALADDVDLVIDSSIPLTEMSEAELSELKFTLSVKDSLNDRELVLSETDFVPGAIFELVDNDLGTREKGDVVDALFQIEYTENYRSRRPIYSLTSEYIEGHWYVTKLTIGI